MAGEFGFFVPISDNRIRLASHWLGILVAWLFRGFSYKAGQGALSERWLAVVAWNSRSSYWTGPGGFLAGHGGSFYLCAGYWYICHDSLGPAAPADWLAVPEENFGYGRRRGTYIFYDHDVIPSQVLA